MIDIQIDTSRMRNHGNELMEIAVSFGNEFNSMFERLVNMPSRTLEWKGEAAVAFSNRSIREKRQYMLFKDELFRRGQLLIDFANILDADIRSLRR
jgi:hypothetical protein